MKLVLAGEGAFGVKHLEAIAAIPDVEVVSLAGGVAEATKATAERFGIPHWTLDLAEALARPGVEAALLATPTPIHAAQAIQVLEAGKHVMVEIPMADSLADLHFCVSRAALEHRQASRELQYTRSKQALTEAAQ